MGIVNVNVDEAKTEEEEEKEKFVMCFNSFKVISV